MSEPKKMVKVVKKVRYAGEDITQVIEALEDSKEAKEWPLWKKDARESSASKEDTTKEQKSDLSTLASTSAAPPKSKTLASIPRKRKTLGDVPTGKAKKISTLDKSLMDWNSHLSTNPNRQMRDELEANRRAGGYIERVEFMQRVSERKEEGRQMATSKRRRA